MNNTKQIIDNHNKRILTASTQIDNTATAVAATIDTNKTCNCRQKNTCPLDGNCLQSSVIYQATVKRKDNNTTETYIGLTENDFKTRYRNHTASFRHAMYISPKHPFLSCTPHSNQSISRSGHDIFTQYLTLKVSYPLFHRDFRSSLHPAKPTMGSHMLTAVGVNFQIPFQRKLA